MLAGDCRIFRLNLFIFMMEIVMRRAGRGVCGMILIWTGLQVVAARSPVPQEFRQEEAVHFTSADGLPSRDIQDIWVRADGAVVTETADGRSVYGEGSWTRDTGEDLRDPPARASIPGVVVHQSCQDREGNLYAATDEGLWIRHPEGQWEVTSIRDGLGRAWGVEDVRGVAVDAFGRLWAAMPAGIACRKSGSEGWQFFEGRDGLPYSNFTRVAAGPDSDVWFATHIGVVRYHEGQWAYRQGRRWLIDDDVRAIAIDGEGNAWCATAGGVTCLRRRPMTLAKKARHYEAEIEDYLLRTPYGYTSEVSLESPGDRSRVHYHPSDNDGLWTAMYGAGECFAYAATGDPKAKKRADRAFRALQFLQDVTQGGPFSPPLGFVARTIQSTRLPDPNLGRRERDEKSRREDDALWKVYEPRWPRSADGKWFWKSDTSSDELDGHFFFYPLYFDLVAESDSERTAVRRVVSRLADHLIEHGFYLVDHDGRPTRWGVFAPKSLNHDPAWWPERGLNSLSILSYLAVAAHITGDEKYTEAARRLREQHAYHTNLMVPKIQNGPGSGNQSDDEMAFMCFYNLLKYTRKPELRQRYLYSFYNYWTLEQPEMNPFFNFAYAAYGLEGSIANPWGRFAVRPWDGWLEDAAATLYGFPLDRVNWGHRNSHRLDLVPLPRQQAVEPYEPMHKGRGYRTNGKVLPVEERFFAHWNTDPWQLDYSGNGTELASGTVFLLPYYMGLYHGFIAAEP